MQQSYHGLLLCADCTSLETALFLDEDGTFLLQETYRGSKNGDQTFVSNGKWARTADKLVLTDSTGENCHCRLVGKSLEMLDQGGAPIESKLNYRLNPSEQPWPKTRGVCYNTALE
ncbi:MAG: hypothetical protein G5700_00670 [Serratia symbiotica]|nr:hypothetical protein [Serratia symbiotica]